MTYLRFLLLALPLFVLFVPASADEKKAEEGFVDLFDGKTLKGWVPVNVAPETFFVKDGMLITTGQPVGLLRSEKRYENFIMELEYMHVKPKGNSGIFVWADALPAVGSPFTRAIEVQVLDGLETANYTSHGDVFAIFGAKLTPDRPHPAGWARCLPSEKRAKPAGQWNHYRITCNDGTLKLAVNGKEVSGGSKITPRKGYLCIESEGSECRFRNLKIKELPSTMPKPEEECPEAKGHMTLFTGLDLRGWKPDNEKAWKAGGNVLRCVAEKGGTIATEKEFARYELVFDIRAPKGSEARVAVGDEKVSLSKADAGKWFRKTVTGKGGITIIAEGPVEFTNLFLRELK